MFLILRKFQLSLFFIPQLYKYVYPQSHWSMQLTVTSSGSQLLLSCSSLLFHFRFKNEFIIEICKVEHLKKKCLSCGKWNSFAWQFFFHPTRVFGPRLWIENHCWNVRVFIKKQIMKPFFSGKILACRQSNFKTGNCSIWNAVHSWCLRFAIQTSTHYTVSTKKVSSLLRGRTKTIVYVMQGFFQAT